MVLLGAESLDASFFCCEASQNFDLLLRFWCFLAVACLVVFLKTVTSNSVHILRLERHKTKLNNITLRDDRTFLSSRDQKQLKYMAVALITCCVNNFNCQLPSYG